ncbi:MAG: ABC transporter ATP-binding protein [Candidatus Euphemobacter frigidus]|nr:ABC transporter ATP-binding protein [Candidatus Euphemobacter frigidus]MDP8275401.1 ABC transporter ATP-binding protein [Candidatus Euphemobacter frigidus]
MSNIAISLKNISKKFPIYDSPLQRLKEAIRMGNRRYHREFWALRDISLEVPEGVTLGILGQNGSGKTTLLQLIAGIMEPTSGEISVQGRVSTILELGAGFNPDFTGRENAFLSGIILGLSPAEITGKMAEIIAFAEIGEFIDQPVKTYSSGMYVRLAFAVAVALEPEILLIDEVLAVGDAYFQHKCTRKIRDFQKQGKTIVFVTHNIESVLNICHQAMILDYSRLLARGEPGEIVKQYLALIDEREREHTLHPDMDALSGKEDGKRVRGPADYSRYGGREAEITGLEILNKDGEPTETFFSGEEIVIRFHVSFNEDVKRFVFGNIFRNKWGLNIFGTNTRWHGRRDFEFRRGEHCTVTFIHRANFADGTYSLNPAASAATGKDTYRTLDWINNAAIIRVRNPRRMEGYINLPTEIEVEKNVEE